MKTVYPALPHDFKGWLLLRGGSTSTADQKIKDILRLNRLGVKLNFKSFEKFVKKLLLEGKSSSYINHQISSVRVYCHFLKSKGVPVDEKLNNFKFMPTKTREKQVMSTEEIDRFLRLPGKTYKYKVWTLFFSIIAFTGMRTMEASKLRVEDVDFGRNVFILKNTKTSEDRLVPIPKLLVKSLNKRIDRVKSGYLFSTHNKEGHITCSYWGAAFRERLVKLGIVRPNLTPYSLRHSYATEMLQVDGVNIYDVQALLGHRRLETTQQYYHLGTKRIQRVSEKYPGIVKSDPVSILIQINEMIDRLELFRDSRFRVDKTCNGVSLVFRVSIKP